MILTCRWSSIRTTWEIWARTQNTENLVLKILRRLRNDMTDLRNETRDGFNRVERRLEARD